MTRFLPLLRRANIVIWSALLTVALTLPAQTRAGEYTFGVVPQFEARRLMSIWSPILDELERRTGHRFRMIGSPRIPDFEDDFMHGLFDFAYMNPYHALIANELQGYRPIVRDGARDLFGVLVVRQDSPYQNVSELAGQTIAFPAPNALGAALLMRADLDRQFALDYRASYVATHSSAYLNVVFGEAAAAGGVMSTLEALSPAARAQLRILYETTRMPPHPVTVHPRVPEDVITAVQTAFVEMAATQSGAALLAQVPIRSAVEAREHDYDALRELRLSHYYIKPASGQR